MKKYKVLTILISILIVLFINPVLAQENDKKCLLYFTGVGCPHCANSDPMVLEQLTSEYNNLVVIEYEIYQQRENAPLFLDYNDKYQTGTGIPMLIINEEKTLLGDNPIIKNVKYELDSIDSNNCLLLNNSVEFNELDLNELKGRPKIWFGDKVLIKTDDGFVDSEKAKEALATEDLESMGLEKTEPIEVHFSGKILEYSEARKIGENWIIQYEKITNENQNENNSSLPVYFAVGFVVILAIISTIYFIKRGK